jgi:hypothetical protein
LSFVIRHSLFARATKNPGDQSSPGDARLDHARFHPSYRQNAECRVQNDKEIGASSALSQNALLSMFFRLLSSVFCSVAQETQLHSALPRRLAAGLH